MKPLAAIVMLGLLAACGADGDPIRPEPKDAMVTRDSFSIEGEAWFGVSGVL